MSSQARRRYGDQVRKLLRDDYHAPAVAQATTRRLKGYVDEGFLLRMDPEEVADRIALWELQERRIRDNQP